jgi:3-hydroxybutyryl-CoA dehydrogenase
LTVVGVAGAGTMGAGIAALATGAGLRVRLYDPETSALSKAPEGVESVSDLAAFADCELVIEAAPEDLAVKRDLFARLAEVVSADCVLATNTSSLSVTALAAGLDGPERVVGMHVFNPPAKMRLVEVVAGAQSGEAALAAARATGEAMGKHVIDAADGPGFLVNRCNRPFSLEAMRIVQAGAASVEQVDAACRRAGFRMGPFALMDLVGIDVGLAVARSFHEQSFGEPRWRPSPLAARLVAAGRLGRKTGRGFYEYA